MRTCWILTGLVIALLLSTKVNAYDGGPETRLLCVASSNVKPDMTLVNSEWRARLKTDRRCPEGEVLVILPPSVPPLFDTRPPMREPTTPQAKPEARPEQLAVQACPSQSGFWHATAQQAVSVSPHRPHCPGVGLG